MRPLVSVSVFVVLVSGSSLLAFDGNRKGFTLGYGLGYVLSARLTEDPIGLRENDNALGSHSVFGWGIGSQNLVSVGGYGSAYNPARSDITGIEQGLVGFSWSHYFEPKAPSWFTTIMIGRFWSEVSPIQDDRYAVGLAIGGGRELLPHVNLGVYWYGSRMTHEGITANHSVVSIILTVVAY